MGVNKIILGNEVLIDLTEDTVTTDTLLQGYTAHRADGELITGTAIAAEEEPTAYSPATLNLNFKDSEGFQTLSLSFKYIDSDIEDNTVRTLANTIIQNKQVFSKQPNTVTSMKLILNDGTERDIDINP